MRVLVKGIRGVDDDRDGSRLAAAVSEHEANEGFDRDIAAVRYRDDRLPHSRTDATLDTQSPFNLVADLGPAVSPSTRSAVGWTPRSNGR